MSTSPVTPLQKAESDRHFNELVDNLSQKNQELTLQNKTLERLVIFMEKELYATRQLMHVLQSQMTDQRVNYLRFLAENRNVSGKEIPKDPFDTTMKNTTPK